MAFTAADGGEMLKRLERNRTKLARMVTQLEEIEQKLKDMI